LTCDFWAVFEENILGWVSPKGTRESVTCFSDGRGWSVHSEKSVPQPLKAAVQKQRTPGTAEAVPLSKTDFSRL
jgi:hypothetical protein